MNKEFIPYEQALALKELGFDEPCFAYQIKYQKPIIQIKVKNSKLEKQALIYRNTYKGILPIKITLPTFSQAFRWFREKYKLSGEPQSYQFQFMYQIIYDTLGENICKVIKYDFESHEEAELECLKKLIEICKNN